MKIQNDNAVVKLTLAGSADAEAINALLNVAYRSQAGWTNEADLVAGSRSMIEEINTLLVADSARFLVHKKEGALVACICLEKYGSNTYIGSFAVSPGFQGKGLGAAVLLAAEAHGKVALGAVQFSMSVISARTELIAYYERRGYVKSNKISDYPLHLNIGDPIGEALFLVHLSKAA